MEIILCHTTADFDALGAAVGLTCLKPGSKIVLTGGAHPPVRDFLSLYRDEYALIEKRSVNSEHIRSLTIVDTQQRNRLGKAQTWLDLANLVEITVYDHHINQESDIIATSLYISEVGATTTLIVEELIKENILINAAQATVMALGIHVDTGSLTYGQSTARDAVALAWLMERGANLGVIATYRDPGLSPEIQKLLGECLQRLEYLCWRGYTIAWVTVKTDNFVPGLSGLASQLMQLTEIDALLLAHEYIYNDGELRLTVIGRTQIPHTNLNILFTPFDGGGHSQAASLNVKNTSSVIVLEKLLAGLKSQIPQPPMARDLMSSPVRTIRPETTIAQAQRILLRYGHSGLSVVNSQDKLVGIISRRDLDIALHHGFGHAPVKGYMTTDLKTITPHTELPQIESLMVTYDIGRLPVLENGNLVGIVTRTDVLRQLHRLEIKNLPLQELDLELNLQLDSMQLNLELEHRLAPQLWQLLTRASQAAQARGWHLYLVGGAVRDLLLANDASNQLILHDIDLVVDGFHQSADVGAGVELARELQQIYQNSRLEIHGAFQTAALLWHKDPELDCLWVDIATARTEFYPYPAANPEVEASSIRQDLYRRDFTINAMALRLTSPHSGELLDFFGGLIDLRSRKIRVLHPNSFIEDPTRIYRGVRFAIRFGFAIEQRTAEYIHYAINSGVYDRTVQENIKTPALHTRLKAELKLILQSPYWQSALKLLDQLGALQCIHYTCKLNYGILRELVLLEKLLKIQDRFWQPAQQLPHTWLIRLEILISSLEPEYRSKVAENLQLSDSSVNRLTKLEAARLEINRALATCELASAIFNLLQKYDSGTLMLIAVKSSREIRRKIWYYWRDLVHVQPLLKGDDLKKMGYKPGPIFKQILDHLLFATLDGKIKTKTQAMELLTEAINSDAPSF
ncbi:MAG: CBS domain-containing protein [Cylindrospermopsis raciborskii]|uniref:CBS domain-containing protein n=1 Tax=Cylindrospermopsis raciborskii TaxID=77022 RepID=UPI003D0FCCC6